MIQIVLSRVLMFTFYAYLIIYCVISYVTDFTMLCCRLGRREQLCGAGVQAVVAAVVLCSCALLLAALAIILCR